MIYYGIFAAHGRENLAEVLNDPNPFELPGEIIIERVMAAGFTPDLSTAQSDPHGQKDAMAYVTRGDGATEERQTFLVGIDVGGEWITVEEERETAYDPDD